MRIFTQTEHNVPHSTTMTTHDDTSPTRNLSHILLLDMVIGFPTFLPVLLKEEKGSLSLFLFIPPAPLHCARHIWGRASHNFSISPWHPSLHSNECIDQCSHSVINQMAPFDLPPGCLLPPQSNESKSGLHFRVAPSTVSLM